MQSNNFRYLEEAFQRLQSDSEKGMINSIRKEGFETFNKNGLPNFRNEEWKYTRINGLFNKEYHLGVEENKTPISKEEIDALRLPGHENANEIVFVNGRYVAELSNIRSANSQLSIMKLEDAQHSDFQKILTDHLDKSSLFIEDGIHALNSSFIKGGIFVFVNKNEVLDKPLYFYHISDTRENHMLSHPRSLVYVSESAKLQLAETYITLGSMDSFTNEVIEIVVDTNAIVEYYKFQNDKSSASQVGTTHIRQIGKSYVHCLTFSLDGGMIRNNTDIIMEVEANEAHMYGLYFLKGNTHVDNHTLVDNTKPNCFSNELYKGIVDDKSTGVFSGKIFVRPDAQKTNAYQSNKNILLSDDATVNTKPQLEIFADDVKCSHGCTVGQLDTEALYYLRTRGISKELAESMLLKAFAQDIVDQIKVEPLRIYAAELIEERLS